MNIYVTNNIFLEQKSIPDKLRSWLKDELTLENPKYTQAVKHGYSAYNIERFIRLFKESPKYFVIPRGMGKALINYLRENRIEYRIHEDRLLLPKVDFTSRIKLRDYQKIAVETMLKGTQGFLVSPCGSGKTVMMIEMMTRLKQPTLFIVHQKELMEQIVNTAVSLTDVTKEEIGILGSGKRIVGERMTVATIQTLNRIDINDLKEKFGAIFIDEAHHLAAKSFYEVISQFRGCYRFAVSATPNRSDGLTKMVYACTGPIIHEITQAHVPTIIPSLKVVRTEFKCSSSEHSDIVKKLIADQARNEMIIDTIKSDVLDNYCLVLSDRVEHLKKLQALITKELPALRVEILTGSIPKKKRKEIMERAKSKEIDILLATQLAREGLDIPHLNRLFLTYPKKSAASVQQEVGRIMRPAEGKESAVVYDFLDSRSGLLFHQFKKRKEVYDRLGVKAM